MIEYIEKKNKNKIHVKKLDYSNKRRTSDPLYKFKGNMRWCIFSGIMRARGKKESRTEEILGCSFIEARNYLIETALVNYGHYCQNIKYHIDHVIPISSAKTEEDVLRLNHISNLQYLTEKDNLKKGAN